MREPDCGGCKGQGAHSRRCRTQPGWFWYRLQDMAEDLADTIGSNDVTSANMGYAIAARMKARAEDKMKDERVSYRHNGVEHQGDCQVIDGRPCSCGATQRVSQLACPHNVPNFGPPCPICD